MLACTFTLSLSLMHTHTIKVHYYSVMHVVPMQLVGEDGDCFLA